MIKASELRIGNLVSKNGEWFETDFITINMAHNYEPIQLTTEILVRCGFEDDKKEMIRRLRGNDFVLDGYSNDYNGFYLGRIDYLHQLQNLYFALTGEELIVNL